MTEYILGCYFIVGIFAGLGALVSGGLVLYEASEYGWEDDDVKMFLRVFTGCILTILLAPAVLPLLVIGLVAAVGFLLSKGIKDLMGLARHD